MIKNAFKLVPKYKSGIGQVTVNGKMTEVKAVKFTLNKKFVNSSRYGKLNNHDGLQGENENGDIRIMLFTTQEKSKSFFSKTQKDKNTFVSKKNICGNNQDDQYISGVSIDPQVGTYNIAHSEKGRKVYEG